MYLIFGSGPSQRFVLVYESSHLNGFTISYGIDVSDSPFMPRFTAFSPDSHVNKNNDTITSDDKLFRFAGSFRYAGLRLRKITFYPLNPVVGTTAGKLGRFAPLDSAVKRF